MMLSLARYRRSAMTLVAAASLAFALAPAATAQFTLSTYDDAWLQSYSLSTLYVYAQMELDGIHPPVYYRGVCLTLRSPDGLRVATEGSAQICQGLSTGGPQIDNQATMQWDATTTGNYTVDVIYKAGYSFPPSVYSTAQKIIGVGVSATNYRFGWGDSDGCYYNIDCDNTPTCGTPQGWAVASSSTPCGAYWVQQFGSVLYPGGMRKCYAMPYIPPNFFSGKNASRAGCT